MGFSDWIQTSEGTINFIAVCLTVIFGVLTIVLYFKGRRVKRPVYAIHSAHLIRNISDRVNLLEVRYAGEVIPNLTSSRIAFWNQGKETIERDEIAEGDPLTIKAIPGLKILDAKIVRSVNTANRCEVYMNGSAVAINFDFLDFDEGAIVQVLHTGNSSSDLTVTGTIKGAGRIRERRSFRKPPPLYGWLSSAAGIAVCFVVPLVMATCVVFIKYYGSKQLVQTGLLDRAISSWVMVVFASMGYWGLAFLSLWRRVPPGLELFDEE